MGTLKLFTKLCRITCNLNPILRNNKSLITNSLNLYSNNTKYLLINNIFIRNYAQAPKLLSRQVLIKGVRNSSNIVPTISLDNTQEKLASLQVKKRPVKKKKSIDIETQKPPGLYDVVAFATADKYKLEELLNGLKEQDVYTPKNIDNNVDVLHAIAKYEVGKEPTELFFFRQGTVIMWNITELESSNILNFLKQYECEGYSERLLQNEAEYMNYKYLEQGKPCISPIGDIVVSPNDNILEKYTFSNAMALSVKLGIWEASLEKYIREIESVKEILKKGMKIKMTEENLLRKRSKLLVLRHEINLSSGLLDTPDFYWETDQLEVLYSQICSYFTISRRTGVLNDKINHCVELVESLSAEVKDKRNVRLEWMIIILIMAEVCFEMIHYLERFYL